MFHGGSTPVVVSPRGRNCPPTTSLGVRRAGARGSHWPTDPIPVIARRSRGTCRPRLIPTSHGPRSRRYRDARAGALRPGGLWPGFRSPRNAAHDTAPRRLFCAAHCRCGSRRSRPHDATRPGHVVGSSIRHCTRSARALPQLRDARSKIRAQLRVAAGERRHVRHRPRAVPAGTNITIQPHACHALDGLGRILPVCTVEPRRHAGEGGAISLARKPVPDCIESETRLIHTRGVERARIDDRPPLEVHVAHGYAPVEPEAHIHASCVVGAISPVVVARIAVIPACGDPTHIGRTVHPVNPGRAVVGGGQPHPAMNPDVRPAPVVIREPAPRLVRNPDGTGGAP